MLLSPIGALHYDVGRTMSAQHSHSYAHQQCEEFCFKRFGLGFQLIDSAVLDRLPAKIVMYKEMGTLTLGLLINSSECSRITENCNTETDGNFVLGHVVVGLMFLLLRLKSCIVFLLCRSGPCSACSRAFPASRGVFCAGSSLRHKCEKFFYPKTG